MHRLVLPAFAALAAVLALPALAPPYRSGEVLTYRDTYTGTSTVWSAPGASPSAAPFSGAIDDTLTYTYRQPDHDFGVEFSNAEMESNTIFGFAHEPGGRLRESDIYVTTFDKGSSDASTLLYPNDRLDALLPLVRGAAWSGAAAATSTFTGTVEQGQTQSNLDGSYSFLGYRSAGRSYHSTADVRSNGSGQRTEQYTGDTPFVESVGVPKLQGSSWVIPGTRSASVALPATPRPATPFAAVDWYPGGRGALPLYVDRTRVQGASRTPRACGSQSRVSATETVEDYRRIDPIRGVETAFVQTSYFGAGGYVVCQLIATETQAYDVATGLPLKKTTRTDRLVLTSATGAPAGIVRAALANLAVHPVEGGRAIARFLDLP